jgi:hypothetical protein
LLWLRPACALVPAATARGLPYWQQKSTWRLRKVLVVSTKFGRREWTRTIDPHHVKVVL